MLRNELRILKNVKTFQILINQFVILIHDFYFIKQFALTQKNNQGVRLRLFFYISLKEHILAFQFVYDLKWSLANLNGYYSTFE